VRRRAAAPADRPPAAGAAEWRHATARCPSPLPRSRRRLGPPRRPGRHTSGGPLRGGDGRVPQRPGAREPRGLLRGQRADRGDGGGGPHRRGRAARGQRPAGDLRAERHRPRVRVHPRPGPELERRRAGGVHPARPRLQRDALGAGGPRGGRLGHPAPRGSRRRGARPGRPGARAGARRGDVGGPHRRLQPHRVRPRPARRGDDDPRGGRSPPRGCRGPGAAPPGGRERLGDRQPGHVALQVVWPPRRGARAAARAAARGGAVPGAPGRLPRPGALGDRHPAVRGDRRDRRCRRLPAGAALGRGGGRRGRAPRPHGAWSARHPRRHRAGAPLGGGSRPHHHLHGGRPAPRRRGRCAGSPTHRGVEWRQLRLRDDRRDGSAGHRWGDPGRHRPVHHGRRRGRAARRRGRDRREPPPSLVGATSTLDSAPAPDVRGPDLDDHAPGGRELPGYGA
jgi:hypothetical protein